MAQKAGVAALGDHAYQRAARDFVEQEKLWLAEAFKTFIMGIGMALIVASDRAEAVEAALAEAGEAPVRIGFVVSGAGVVRYLDEE